MKYLIILCFFFSCCNARKTTDAQINCKDTIRIYLTDTVEISRNEQIKCKDTIYLRANADSLKKVITELNHKLFLANYRVERVRYYLKIVQRKPSQLKFLVSWINRAVQ